MISEKTFQSVFVWLLFAAVIILAFLIIKPVFLSIVLGLILAYIFSAPYKWLAKKIKRKSLAAMIICFLAAIIIFVPLVFLSSVFIRQAFDVYSALQSININQIIQKILPFIANYTKTDLSLAFTNIISNATNVLMEKFTDFMVNLPIFLLHLLVTLFVFFYGLKDGDTAIEYIKNVLPLSKETSDKFFKKSREITYFVIYSEFIIGLVQGIAAGIGFYIAGIDNALFFTIIAVVVGILPILGVWLVWIPAIIFLIAQGNMTSAIFLLLYNLLFVAHIDNFLRSYIVSRKTEMPNSLILIGMVGGLFVFGILGLIVGPLILAYVLIILEFYRERKFASIFSSESA